MTIDGLRDYLRERLDRIRITELALKHGAKLTGKQQAERSVLQEILDKITQDGS